MKNIFIGLFVLSLVVMGFQSTAHAQNAGGIPVLLYHQISHDGSWLQGLEGPTVTHVDLFTDQMNWLAQNGYKTLSVRELVSAMTGRTRMPAKAVVVMFDDSWISQFNATWVLDQLNMKAVFAALLTPEWSDGPYMTFEQLIYLDAHPRYEVISHSMTHASMLDLLNANDIAGVNEELRDSRQILSELFARNVTGFAWPYGEYNPALIQYARNNGYRELFTVNPGLNIRGTSVLEIKRSTIDGRCPLSAFIQTVQTGAEIFCGP